MSKLAYVPYSGAGSSVVPLELACGKGPAAGYLGSDSRGYSCQASLDRGILEDSLKFHSFARVKFSWVERPECAYTIFL